MEVLRGQTQGEVPAPVPALRQEIQREGIPLMIVQSSTHRLHFTDIMHTL